MKRILNRTHLEQLQNDLTKARTDIDHKSYDQPLIRSHLQLSDPDRLELHGRYNIKQLELIVEAHRLFGNVEQVITLKDLIKTAEMCRKGIIVDIDEHEMLNSLARSFVANLAGTISAKFTEHQGDEFCRALGFDHLIEE